MNNPIKVELCFELEHKRMTISEFNWDFKDFILKFIYITKLWTLKGCTDVSFNIKKIIVEYAREKEQLGHIMMIILKLMSARDKNITLPYVNILCPPINNRPNTNIYSNVCKSLNDSAFKYVINGKISINVSPISMNMQQFNTENLISVMNWVEDNFEDYVDIGILMNKIWGDRYKNDIASEIINKGISQLVGNVRFD